ncbi:putative ubiquitin-conjugating enzyme E2 38 [Senna tora]|uniref:Putative ubiquitin-conjugating enzyme E2 38 n=1 Tax=Senna tora TaxID=362788 RepID=A0A834W2X2_9FABA|nr:putative ubiquitin-conjugating enzyme E2 38 [Senna tora]
MENPRTSTFNQFDVVSQVPDHHFHLSSFNGSDRFTDCRGAVYKKIMQEWRILQRNLPESIFVRVSETRIDLLRAAIIGAAGTPYHDGLFFFDIAFPPDYPSQPPKVHYRSFGFSLNPNLYYSGHVCLSLLNTWRGQTSERWNPTQSTVLQVLLSIQSLVLCENPYFNEPVVRPFKSSLTVASQKYDRHAFVLTCKSAIQLIRNPPEGFEPLVKAHFRERANAILAAIQAYANGRARVGFYRDGGSSGQPGKISGSFLESMEWVYPSMVEKFRGIGAPVESAAEALRLGAEAMKKKMEIARRKREGIQGARSK